MSTSVSTTTRVFKWILALLVALGIGAYATLVHLVPGLARGWRSHPVEARIVACEVIEEQRPNSAARFRPRVRATYAWEGRDHEADLLSDTFLASDRRRDRVVGDLLEYPVGASVTLWVDPEHPEAGSDARGFPPWTCPLLIGVIAVVRMATDEFARALALRRRRRLHEPWVPALDPGPLTVEGLLTPRATFTAMFLAPMAFAVLAWHTGRDAPHVSALVTILLGAGALAAGWRFAMEGRDELRWRRCRLVPPSEGRDPAEHEIRPVPPGELSLRLRLVREERELEPGGRVARWLTRVMGNEWSVTQVVAEREVPHEGSGAGIRLLEAVEPFGPLGPVPTWKGATAPLVVDERERRLHLRLLLHWSGRTIWFSWGSPVGASTPSE